MYYPKECFSKNITATQNAKREYEQKQERMYKWIEETYPTYYSMGLREQMRIREEYKGGG